LIPATGGVFVITIFHPSPENFSTQETVLWDRKILGGFPGGCCSNLLELNSPVIQANLPLANM
jgi:predicted Rdx family selenoprotein